MMKTVAFIQARMSSTRYPGKVLTDLAGIPMILFMIQRVKRARMIDKVILVTSTDPSDEALADSVRKAGEPVFRGSLEDVLDRFASAAQKYPAQNYVRLTGDCPLSDPELIDSIIDLHLRSRADYTCNTNPPTYPDGLDVEVFTAKTLSDAAKSALRPSEREHVTAWMYDSKNGLHCENFVGSFDASHMRLTIDYPDDVDAVRRIISAFEEPISADYFDILRVIGNDPSITLINQHARNENFLN
tara:strand:- start:334 stop:1065 length:732 start_codon:yes stop_codon:yes gene_type:complete